MATLANLTVDIATNTAKFASGMERVDRRMKNFQRSAKKMQRAAGAIFTAVASGAAARAVRQTVENTAAISELADRAGVSAERMQELQKSFADMGGVADKVTSGALRRFNRRLGLAIDGTGAAKDTFGELGVAMRDASGNIRDTEAVLDDAIRALGDIENESQRAAKASEIFGEDAGPALAAVLGQGSQALDQHIGKLREQGRIMSNETVAKSREANDAFNEMSDILSTKLTKRIVNNTDAIIKLANALFKVADAALKAADKVVNFVEGVAEGLARLNYGSDTVVGRLTDDIAKLDQALNGPQGKMALPENLRKQVEAINEPARVAIQNLIDQKQAQIEAAKADEQRAKAQRELNSLMDAAVSDQARAVGVASPTSSASTGGGGGSAAAADLFDFNAAMNDGIRDQARIADLYQRNQDELDRLLGKYDEGAARLNTYNEAQDELNRLFEAGMISQTQFTDALGEVMNEFDGLNRVSQETGEQMNEFWQEAADNMQRTMSGLFFDVMQGEFSDMAGSFKKTIDQMVADLMASQLLDFVKNKWSKTDTGGGLVDTIGGFASNIIGGMFGGGRAIGGSVSGGTPYMVGEHGPEMFVPPGAGSIVPNNQMGGGDINVSVNVQGIRDEGGLRQASNRVAADAARALQKARRDM